MIDIESYISSSPQLASNPRHAQFVRDTAALRSPLGLAPHVGELARQLKIAKSTANHYMYALKKIGCWPFLMDEVDRSQQGRAAQQERQTRDHVNMISDRIRAARDAKLCSGGKLLTEDDIRKSMAEFTSTNDDVRCPRCGNIENHKILSKSYILRMKIKSYVTCFKCALRYNIIISSEDVTISPALYSPGDAARSDSCPIDLDASILRD